MKKITCCGLHGEGPWHDFLTKGCYDQRLLLRISAFVRDHNYFCTSLRRDMAQYGYRREAAEKYLGYFRDVHLDCRTIETIPEEYKTKELCQIAVRNLGTNLRYVPRKIITAELCLVAVRDSSFALVFVPEELKTLELCLVALEWSSIALDYIPEKFKTLEFCLEIVKKKPYAISFIPKELVTPIREILKKG